MRYLLGLILFAFLFSCNSNSGNKENSLVAKSETTDTANVNLPQSKKTNNKPDIDYQNLDSLIKNQIEKLDKIYSSTPFYAIIKGQKFFIVCDGFYEIGRDRFSQGSKYGIADESLQLILDLSFDKIYNPDLTIKDCFEVKRGSKVGLFNYKTKVTLEPQFDFICQGSSEVGDVGYGFKDGKWFEINNKSLKEIRIAEFNPRSTIQKMDFDIENLGESMMYDSYYQIFDDEIITGKGFMVVPSFIEKFGLMPNSFYDGIILDDRKLIDYGIESARIKTNDTKSLDDGIFAFFISAFELGVSAREYVVESERIVTYNAKSSAINVIEVPVPSQYGYLCDEFEQRIVNDSIVEVYANFRQRGNGRYDFESKYSYFKILKDGKIVVLDSDRHYDFSKYAVVDEDYFKGCFGDLMQETDSENHNVWRTDHLTIEDLDLMRNEIFAEYGYIFKSEKWSKYFAEKSWYKPRFENVDNKLSELDKLNIQTILSVAQKMKGQEKEFLNRRAAFYYEGP